MKTFSLLPNMSCKMRALPRLNIAVLSLVLFFAPDQLPAQTPSCAEDIEEVGVNGYTLHYYVCGEGEPIIFVHGSTGSLSWIDAHVSEFSDTYQVLSYSRRFHTPNERPSPGDEYSLAQHVDDLASLIEALELPRAHIVGHSYGGYVALGLALSRPELVRTVVLAEPPVLSLLTRTAVGTAVLKSWNRQTRDPARAAFEKGEVEEGLRLFLDAVVGEGWFDGLEPSARDGIVQEAGPEFSLELMTETEKYMPELTCEDLSEVSKPVLLITGENSIASLFMVTAELEKCLPNESHSMIPGAGHIMFQNRTAFSEAIHFFLAAR